MARMPARFHAVQPVLPTRDVAAAVAWYVERLGFQYAFGEGNYVGVRRDAIEIHLQWNGEGEFASGSVGPASLRFVVDDPDLLFAELETKGVFHERTALRNTPWGTREFAFYGPDRNGLTFYRDLRADELASPRRGA